ncbi:UDP-N-acetylglucosamine 2-epimerase (hydrolyzing) [Permianibacter sp. IMCC34836]|uniref:UDP-N-acetylglucosamine 2-epimerase n=1 Tax=Permianibacter fluminis TaxID=2738515 RepID=UPI001553476C|nr:UDP-N-acetylglucosamine 2-epimerase [Permianibacter fluminis]NQD37415.1 UDP-N-acetylglucosamine 2-epimerase (hydrolyzing) [Permianibacter fluminis]
MNRRKICYVTGTRADFGLMRSALNKIHIAPSLELQLLVTGMHLADRFGETVSEIEASGFPVSARVGCQFQDFTGAEMAKNIGRMLIGFVDAMQTSRPDTVIVLGDRGEMLAATIAAVHLRIPVVHLHGGERSGTVDEPVRHAISKFANWHLVATDESMHRLVKMGERADRIKVIGAPGLDGLIEAASVGRSDICRDFGFDEKMPIALYLFHPTMHDAFAPQVMARNLMEALLESKHQVIALMPNSDAGSEEVAAYLQGLHGRGSVKVMKHLERHRFVSAMSVADIMVGNSSSGIIEAASFGTPVLNVGCRQNLRQRNSNVTDCDGDRSRLSAVVAQISGKRFSRTNCYGDGMAGSRVVDFLLTADFSQNVVDKCNAY